MYWGCEGGGVAAVWQFEGAHGCFADCEVGKGVKG